jgi:hypothetical protein
MFLGAGIVTAGLVLLFISGVERLKTATEVRLPVALIHLPALEQCCHITELCTAEIQ